jgi:aryl-alcohol dehydrogenase-like predicted oxidoreductase
MWWDRERAEVARKFDLVEALEKLAADAGCSLTHLALAFTTTHPGVTSAIIGPRTPDQAQDLLSGLDLRLPSDVLDRIDELVPPGTDVDATNTVPLNPDLTDVVKRRRGSF